MENEITLEEQMKLYGVYESDLETVNKKIRIAKVYTKELEQLTNLTKCDNKIQTATCMVAALYRLRQTFIPSTLNRSEESSLRCKWRGFDFATSEEVLGIRFDEPTKLIRTICQLIIDIKQNDQYSLLVELMKKELSNE